MGNIALNFGAVLRECVDAISSMSFNTVRPPRVVNANISTSPHERVHSRADNTVDGPGLSTTDLPEAWPDWLTNYDGGYESDPRSSGDEGRIMESDEDEPIVQSFQKRVAKLNAGPCRDDHSAWKINSMHPYHTCSRTFNNRLITECWLAGKFIDNFLRDPKFKPKDMKTVMQKEYEIIVDLRKYRREKNNALNAVDGLFKKQYGLLKSYMREFLRSNDETTCILKVTDQEDSSGVFQRFYMCFAAIKRGFANNYRHIFGLDGCFLKHACGGQLLSVMGRDENNQMWPIVWAVVEGETRSSWEWFMRILSGDLNMGDGEGWTVISDQQKGLVPAMHKVWPQAEHRQYARHIYSNWRKVHTGRTLQKQFWYCVKATSMEDFVREAAKLKDYSERAYDDFMAMDPHTFCKSHFKCHSQCDNVDDNMSKTFNSFIFLARYKLIISMLEDIRLSMMDMMQLKRKLITQFMGGIAPTISKKIKEAYQEQLHCQTRWSGTNDYSGFEIHHRGIGHEVNLGEKTCSCRVWDLTGIPCLHAISAILFMRKNPEDFVAHWYKSEDYTNAYGSLLNPESQEIRVDEGPSHVRKKGRPKGSLNKIRCGDMPPSNAPTPASIIIGRRSKAPTTSTEA
ncbi:uncharacterized protein LOC109847447 [Asparagus officinalis]|uniref:uncharacterized protein LOC109847447 n=1 Tax=Asparagus officinalis TaxID=4686 RepID=UPI00098E41EB|nr:uncharacterized protein LOC109847447 [Asparagus officinalis]